MKQFTGDSRADAAIILEAVLAEHERSTDLTNRAAGRYRDARDFALLRELVGGVLRRRMALVRIVNPQVGRGLEGTRPLLREILLCHAYQMMFLDRVPAHARVSGAVNAARRLDGERGAGFVNAVTRAVEKACQPAPAAIAESMELTDLLSIPDVFKDLIVEIEGGMPEAGVLERLCLPSPTAVRVSCDPEIRASAESAVAAADTSAVPGLFSRNSLILDSGRILSTDAVPRLMVPQDEASQMAVEVLAPRDGEKILDLCCGTGIKTSQILDLAPGAEVLAVDLDTKKLDRCKELCRAAGRGKPRVMGADVAALPEELNERFDAVLLDAPCTGSGTMRRRPEVRYLRVRQDFAKAAALQATMLDRALKTLKPGGRLVYAVCSVAGAEGTDVVKRVLAANPGFAIESCGLPEAVSRPDGTVLTLPWRHDLDGFFIAKIRRTR